MHNGLHIFKLNFLRHVSIMIVFGLNGFTTLSTDISVVSWWSVLLLEETGIPGENV
jgi:hypothetical protein